jgi:stearoyl-CoA desaturase (Delta-9 desaturase)
MQSNMSHSSPSDRIVWHNVAHLTLVPLGTLILTTLYFMYGTAFLPIFIFSLIYFIFTSLSVTGGYHRYFAHKSYECSTAVKIFWLLIGAGAFQGSALKWATDHRRHHRFVDTPDDPYNINNGFWYAHMGWLVREDNPKYAGLLDADLQRDKWINLQHRYYLRIAFTMAYLFPALVGWALGSALGGLAIGGGLRLLVSNHGTFFINSLCHWAGRQPYTDENTARDSLLMAILTQGEGYHNYHHKFQYDYRNGIRWYHWDPTKWFVAFLKKVGHASHLKRAPAPQILKARLYMEQKRLVNIGIPAEKLSPFRERVEEAQKKWRVLCEDYQALKANVKERSREKLVSMRQEIKAAKREFRSARMHWGSHTKQLKLAYLPTY